MYLKFNNLDNKYTILKENIKINYPYISFLNSLIPPNESGFIIYNDDDEQLEDYSYYTIIFNHSDNEITFSCLDTIKYVYYILDENNFVINIEVSQELQEETNKICVRSGKGIGYEYADIFEIYDDLISLTPKFRYKNDNIQEISQKDLEEWQNIQLNNAISDKLKEISKECKNNIINGIEHNGEYFSYTTDDQNNIRNLVQLSKATGLSVPYHANNVGCRLYSPEDINAIYVKQEMNVTHHTTYHNQLKLYINSLQTKEEVNRVYYGMELSGEYLDTYNEIMQNANLIVSAFTAN